MRLVEGPHPVQEFPPGTMTQVRAEQSYLLVNSPGSGTFDSPGLKYRRTPCNKDIDNTVHMVPWGAYVQGVPVNEDWIKIGDRYMPIKLNGVTVLHYAPEAGVHLQSSPSEGIWAKTKYL